MFSHIMVGADNMAASKKFYDAVLGTLGHPEGNIDDKGRCFYFTPTGIFSLSTPINGDPACGANGGTVGLQQPVQQRLMPGIKQDSITAARPWRTHLASDPTPVFTWRTYGTHPATRFAPCTSWVSLQAPCA